MKNITWIASYPKSGNTWLRAILYAAVNGEVDINKLGTLVPSFSRPVNIACKNARIAGDPNEIIKYWDKAQKIASDHGKSGGVLLKTHNACGNYGGVTFPSKRFTEKAIYIVRNPRDVAVSYGNHYNRSISQSVVKMLDSQNTVHRDNSDSYVEFLSSWREHFISWSGAGFPVLLLKYEDLKLDPESIIKRILGFTRITPVICVSEIVKLTNFDQLKKSEQEVGFRESVNGKTFFKSGKVNQSNLVLGVDFTKLNSEFGDVMRELKYL